MQLQLGQHLAALKAKVANREVALDGRGEFLRHRARLDPARDKNEHHNFLNHHASPSSRRALYREPCFRNMRARNRIALGVGACLPIR